MYPTSIVPVIIHGRKLGMQWTMGSLIAAEKVFGFFADDKGFAKATASYAEEHGFRAFKVALGFCALRAVEENPPTMEELLRIPLSECAGFSSAVDEVMRLGTEGPLGSDTAKKNEGEGPEEPADAGPSGTGGKPSSRPFTGAGSRRKSSSGSRPGNSG